MKYPISGNNSVALSATSAGVGAATGESLLGRNIPSARNFWLRGVHVWAASGGCQVALYDASVGTARTTANTVFTFNAASGEETVHTFTEPGLQFSTGVCIVKMLSDPSSAFGIGSCGGWGYEG